MTAIGQDVQKGKRPTRSLTDALPYWGIEEGTVILMDGRAEIGIELHPQPAIFMDQHDLMSTWSRVKQVLRLGVPQRQRARFIIESAPSRSTLIDHYADSKRNAEYAVIQEMIQLRRNAFQEMRYQGMIMEHRYFLTCTIPAKKRGRAQSMDEVELKELLNTAQQVRVNMIAKLQLAGLSPKAMSTQESFELMWRYFNPGLAHTKAPRFIPESQRTYMPSRTVKQHGDIDLPTTRRQIVSTNIESHRAQHILIGDRLAKVITLSRLPDTSYINSIDNVVRTMAGRHSYIMIDYDHEHHAQMLRKLGMKLRSTESSAEFQDYGRLDHSTFVVQAEQTRMMEQLYRTGEHIYNTACNIIVFGDNMADMEMAKEQALGAISMLGNCMPVVGQIQNLTIYLKETAPFSGQMSRHAFKAIETTCGDFFPLTAPWQGSANPTSLFRNQLGGLTGINFFDPDCMSWNGMIAGAMGSGKTFLAQSMIRDMIAENVRVVIVDRGMGYSPTVEAVGAPIVMMQPGQNIVINPFELIEGMRPTEIEINEIRLILTGMVELSNDTEQRELELSLITAAINRAYDVQTRMDKDSNGKSAEITDTVYMSGFTQALTRLDTLNGNEISPEVRSIAGKLAARFTRWTGNTPEGKLVDNRTNVDLKAPVILFETSGLDANPEIARVALILLANLVLKNAMAPANRDKRKALIIDEAWALFKHPQAQQLIFDISRRARRYELAFYGISQSVGDFLDITGMVDQINYMFIGKGAGNTEMLMKLPGMTQMGAAYHQQIGMQKGAYAEFLAMIRKQNHQEGDIIRVEAQGMEYWMFTTVREEMNRRTDLVENLGISQADAARMLAAGR